MGVKSLTLRLFKGFRTFLRCSNKDAHCNKKILKLWKHQPQLNNTKNTIIYYQLSIGMCMHTTTPSSLRRASPATPLIWASIKYFTIFNACNVKYISSLTQKHPQKEKKSLIERLLK